MRNYVKQKHKGEPNHASVTVGYVIVSYFSLDWLSVKLKMHVNTTRDIEAGNSLAVARGEWGGDSGKRGLQELL